MCSSRYSSEVSKLKRELEELHEATFVETKTPPKTRVRPPSAQQERDADKENLVRPSCIHPPHGGNGMTGSKTKTKTSLDWHN